MPLLHLEPLPRRTTRGEVLHLLTSAGGIGREQVGRIELRGALAAIEVPAGWEARLVKQLDGIAFKERRLRAWSSGSDSTAAPGDHFQHLARLLQLESEAEARQTQEMVSHGLVDATRGGRLTGLVNAEEAPGLGGRCVVTLTRRNRSQPLPWNRLEPGTPVLLTAEEGTATEGRRGVVCGRGECYVDVALNEPPAETEGRVTYRLDPCNDEAARQRQLAALERARTARGERLADLRQVLLGETAPEFGPVEPFIPLDESLNASQIEAVGFALSARDLAIVHGPPGTGKTTAVVEIIRQAVRRGERVLACAPSNLAVDNLLDRLLLAGEKAVRLGHPARVLPGLREHTLDLLVADHADTRQARKLVREAFALFRQAAKYTRARPEPGARQDMRREAREMLADARRMEAQTIDQVLDSAPILCATLTGLDSEVLGRRQFDLAVLDEAAQSAEPASWLPVLRSKRLVLAGDHCQLPPTVVSPEAAREGFAISLMERLADLYGPTVTRQLNVQYRMHEAIMTFPSLRFYDGTLEAHPSVSSRLLSDLPGVTATPLTETPLLFIDTAGASYDENEEPGGRSRCNPREAELVRRKVRLLLDAGVAPEQIAVIAPYSAQVRLLRERLPVAGLEIDSVDGFQGREKEAVVLSLVRSNTEGEIGFLADVRRMNVALTRARRKLLVVGDSATLSVEEFYADLFASFESAGATQSVWEEVEN